MIGTEEVPVAACWWCGSRSERDGEVPGAAGGTFQAGVSLHPSCAAELARYGSE